MGKGLMTYFLLTISAIKTILTYKCKVKYLFTKRGGLNGFFYFEGTHTNPEAVFLTYC